MSYARWGEGSDVYVYASIAGGVTCCGCFLEEDQDDAGSPYFYELETLLDHLRDHQDRGHKIPDDLFDPLTYDPADFERMRVR